MFGLKKIRIPAYDYQSDGYYFVTIVTRWRQRYFDRETHRQQCEQIFRNVIEDITGVTVDILIIMPDHLHVILVLEKAELPLGEIIRRIKARTSYEFQERLWQPNYYEHIIRTEQALKNIRAYIFNNPNKEPTFSKRQMKNGNVHMPS